jgi:hypothetical protein
MPNINISGISIFEGEFVAVLYPYPTIEKPLLLRSAAANKCCSIISNS